MAKSDEPVVSVIVPVYCVEKYINQCLKSIVSQTYTNLEIILVDDASPDSSGSICDSWAKKDDRIKVIHKSINEGLFKARIAGLEKMTGEYFITVDSDDYIGVDYIQCFLTVAKRSAAQIIIADGFTTIDADDVKRVRKFPKLYGSDKVLDIFMHNITQKKWGWNMWGKMYKASIYRKAKDYLLSIRQNINAGEDTLFAVIFAYFADKTAYVDGYEGYFYRQNNDSITKKMSDELFIRKLDSITTVLFEIEMFLLKIGLRDAYASEVKFLRDWQLSDYIWTIRNEYIRQNEELQRRVEESQQQNHALWKHNEGIVRSRSYKLSRLVSAPYRNIKKMIK